MVAHRRKSASIEHRALKVAGATILNARNQDITKSKNPLGNMLFITSSIKLAKLSCADLFMLFVDEGRSSLCKPTTKSINASLGHQTNRIILNTSVEQGLTLISTN